MQLAGGDSAVMAQNNHLIDGIQTQSDFRQYLQGLVGKNKKGDSFRQINFADYLHAVKTDYSTPLQDMDKVAILVAQGDIVYGQGTGSNIASGDLSRYLRKLRHDKHVKALVLRIDSPGGSAFASEIIRQELLVTQQAGKPVVVSMGSMAASGAYWIAAGADRIFAAPSTITGSIGIF